MREVEEACTKTTYVIMAVMMMAFDSHFPTPTLCSTVISKQERNTTSPTLKKLLAKQAKNILAVCCSPCQHAWLVLLVRLLWNPRWYGLARCQDTNCVARFLPSRLLFISHYHKLARHPAKRRTYSVRRCKLYWIHMANGIHMIMGYCSSRAENGRFLKTKCNAHLVHSNGSL